MITKSVALLMFAISAIFCVVTVLDYRRADATWTIAAKVHRRIATIFAVVGIGLYLLQAFLK